MSFDRLTEIKSIAIAATTKGDLPRIKQILEKKDLHIDTPLDGEGNTCLMLAAKAGHFPLVKYFVEAQKATLNLINKKNETALELADSRTYGLYGTGPYREIVPYLFIRGATLYKKIVIFDFLRFLMSASLMAASNESSNWVQKEVLKTFLALDKESEALIWFKTLKNPIHEISEWYGEALIRYGMVEESLNTLNQLQTSKKQKINRCISIIAKANTYHALKEPLQVLRSDLILENVYLYTEVDRKDSPVSEPFSLHFLSQLATYQDNVGEVAGELLAKFASNGSFETRLMAISLWQPPLFHAQMNKHNLADKNGVNDSNADFIEGLEALYAITSEKVARPQAAKYIFQKIVRTEIDIEKLAYANLRLAASCFVIAETEEKEDSKNKEINVALEIYERITKNQDMYNQLDYFARVEIFYQLNAIDNLHLSYPLYSCYTALYLAESARPHPCRDLLGLFYFGVGAIDEEHIIQWRNSLLRGPNYIYLLLPEGQRLEILYSVIANSAIQKNHREIFFDLYQLELNMTKTLNADLIEKTFNTLMTHHILTEMRCWDMLFVLISQHLQNPKHVNLQKLFVEQLQVLATIVTSDAARLAQTQKILLEYYKKNDAEKALALVEKCAETKEEKPHGLRELHTKFARETKEPKLALVHYKKAQELGDEHAALAVAKLIQKEEKDQPDKAYPAYQEVISLALKNGNQKIVQQALDDVFAIKNKFEYEKSDHKAHVESEKILSALFDSEGLTPWQLLEIFQSLCKIEKGTALSLSALHYSLFKLTKWFEQNIDFHKFALSLIPVGIDLHNDVRKKLKFAEAELEKCKKATAPVSGLLLWVDQRQDRFSSSYQYLVKAYLAYLTSLIKTPNDIATIRSRTNILFDKIGEGKSDQDYWMQLLKDIINPLIVVLQAVIYEKHRPQEMPLLISIYDRLLRSKTFEKITGKSEVQIYAERFSVEKLLAVHPSFTKVDIDRPNLATIFRRNMYLLSSPNLEISRIARVNLNDMCRHVTGIGKPEIAARANFLPAIAILLKKYLDKYKNTNIRKSPAKDWDAVQYLSAAFLLMTLNVEAARKHFDMTHIEMESYSDLHDAAIKLLGKSVLEKIQSTNLNDVQRNLNPAGILFTRSYTANALGIKETEIDAWNEVWQLAANEIIPCMQEAASVPADSSFKQFLFVDEMPALEHKVENVEADIVAPTPNAPSDELVAQVDHDREREAELKEREKQQKVISVPVVDQSKFPDIDPAHLSYSKLPGEAKADKKSDEPKVVAVEIPASVNLRGEGQAVVVEQEIVQVVNPVERVGAENVGELEAEIEGEFRDEEIEPGAEGVPNPMLASPVLVLEPKQDDRISVMSEAPAIFCNLVSDEKSVPKQLSVEPVVVPLERKRPGLFTPSVPAIPAAVPVSMERGPISVSFSSPEGVVAINITSSNPAYVEALLTSIVQTISRFPQQSSTPSRDGLFSGAAASEKVVSPSVSVESVPQVLFQ